MFKCPKCDYQSEVPGNCPTDNEVLVETPEATQEPVTPPTTDESVPAEESSKPTEEQKS